MSTGNIVQLTNQVKGLQGQIQEHGRYLNHLLQEKNDRDLKLECYRTAGSGAMAEAKEAYGWISGRDEELTSLRNSLQEGANQQSQLKRDLAARDKELAQLKTKLGIFTAGKLSVGAAAAKKLMSGTQPAPPESPLP